MGGRAYPQTSYSGVLVVKTFPNIPARYESEGVTLMEEARTPRPYPPLMSEVLVNISGVPPSWRRDGNVMKTYRAAATDCRMWYDIRMSVWAFQYLGMS